MEGTDLGGAARRLVSNAARGVRRSVAGAVFRGPPGWLRLRLASPASEMAPPGWASDREGTLSLLDVLRILETAARDPKVAGLVLRLVGPPGGYARVESLRRALEGFRRVGKPVVVWSESFDTRELWLASAATELVLPPSGNVHLLGVRFEGFFLREVLERIGVRADVLRVGDFKSAAEMFTRDGYSEEAREQLEAMADDVFEAMLRDVAEGRGLEPDAVRALVDRGLLTAEAALEAGLIDACLYPDEIEDRLRELAPHAVLGERPRLFAAAAYLRLRAIDPGPEPLIGGLPRIAYVTARGGIGRGRGHRGIASDTYRELLEPLARRDEVIGVVLRIDSPGGEGVASDLLWRSVRRIAEKKPVIASMGDVAASGGYFLAAGATAIVAEATTITGSIGVVGGKLDVSALYDRLGVGRDAVERGAQAGLHSEARSFTPGERKALREELDALYELFLARVAEGRGRTRDDVHAVAQGRVWSGAGAHARGLVDRLGGPLEALDELRQRAGLGAGERVRLEIHPRLPFFSGVLPIPFSG